MRGLLVAFLFLFVSTAANAFVVGVPPGGGIIAFSVGPPAIVGCIGPFCGWETTVQVYAVENGASASKTFSQSYFASAGADPGVGQTYSENVADVTLLRGDISPAIFEYPSSTLSLDICLCDPAKFPSYDLQYVITPSVPEPSTWAMLLIGFAAIGFASKSRLRRLAGRGNVG
jgi:PEP-CTERM motif